LTFGVEIGGNMRVILKQDVDKLGRKGDVVNVAPGYGRNFLVPKKLAIAVTASNIKMIEIERAALKKKVEVERKSFQGLVEKLNQTSLTFARRAGEKDVIFGSVSSGDIRDELVKLGLDVDKKKILLDEPIKRLGNFTVPIKVYHDDRAAVKVVVVKEEVEEKSSEPAPNAGADKDKE
jgi:large subunit ribosomal protein L9